MIVLATPFRVFFLAASFFAVLAVPVWTLVSTQQRVFYSSLGGMGWHAHEMLYGYAGAVLAGFFLTAARRWTSRPTLSGASLAVLVLFWGVGRGASLRGGSVFATTSLVVDVCFFALLAVGIGKPIYAARSVRNYAFPPLLLGLGACDVAAHLHMRGVAPVLTARANLVAVDILVLIIMIFGGRILPLFTKGAIGEGLRSVDVRDRLAPWLMGAYALLHALRPESDAVSVGALLVGVLTLWRLLGWGASRCLARPILWVLHLGWFLMGLAFTLEGANRFLVFAPPQTFLHLLTIGGIGLMTLGMMARVSLGHTGRELRVPRLVAVAFVLVVVATAARVIAPMANPVRYGHWLWAASLAWSAGFLVLFGSYLGVWLSPRADGAEG